MMMLCIKRQLHNTMNISIRDIYSPFERCLWINKLKSEWNIHLAVHMELACKLQYWSYACVWLQLPPVGNYFQFIASFSAHVFTSRISVVCMAASAHYDYIPLHYIILHCIKRVCIDIILQNRVFILNSINWNSDLHLWTADLNRRIYELRY
jgi:hypothetical protein